MPVMLTIDRREVEAETDRLTRAYLGAARDTVGQLTRELEKALEGATRAAVPGRLWRAWKSEVYPRDGIARKPAGKIFVNGLERSRGALNFQTQSGLIRGHQSQFLAIPTPAAGPRGRRRDLTPSDWEARTGQRLQFVYRPRGPSLLVAVGRITARAGRYRPLLKRDARRIGPGHGATVVVFLLIPQVAFSNRFAVAPIVQSYGGRIGPNLLSRLGAIR